MPVRQLGTDSLEKYQIGLMFLQELTKTILLVLASPKIFGLPKLLTKLKGSTVSLGCLAKGFPYIDYKWIKQEPSKRLTRPISGASLVLTNVTENDEGVYTCVATNAVGNKSFDVRLNVQSEYFRRCSNLFNVTKVGICSKIEVNSLLTGQQCS